MVEFILRRECKNAETKNEKSNLQVSLTVITTIKTADLSYPFQYTKIQPNGRNQMAFNFSWVVEMNCGLIGTIQTRMLTIMKLLSFSKRLHIPMAFYLIQRR